MTELDFFLDRNCEQFASSLCGRRYRLRDVGLPDDALDEQIFERPEIAN